MLGIIDKLNLREVNTVIVWLQNFLKLKAKYWIIKKKRRNRVILKSGQTNERRSIEKYFSILHTTGEGILYLLSIEKGGDLNIKIKYFLHITSVERLGKLIAAWAIFI